MENKHFLHEYIRHTNVERPTPNIIGYNDYPLQVEDAVGSIEDLIYTDQRFVYNDINPDSKEQESVNDRIHKDKFLTLRYDNKLAYKSAKVIYMSTNCRTVIVTQQDKSKDYLCTPDEFEYLVGMRVYPEYKGLTREAYVFAVQALEPGFAVIVEYLDNDYCRFICDDELYFTYNPDDIYIPVIKPDLADIRRRLLEGRIIYK